MAHRLIHSLQQRLAPGSIPLFTSDGLNLYFYAVLGSFYALAPGGSEREQHVSVAGGAKPDLWPSQEKLSTAQAGSSHPGDAPWNREPTQSHLTRMRLLGTVEPGLY
jgi:hypothetical protein